MHRDPFAALLPVVLVCLQLTAIARAETHHVPDDYPTIQSAIDHAYPGDVILIADGTYHEDITFNRKSITVASVNGPDLCRLIGNYKPITATEVEHGTLEGITVTGLHQAYIFDQPIDFSRSGLTIRNCHFVQNEVSAVLPGVEFISADDASLEFEECVFSSTIDTGTLYPSFLFQIADTDARFEGCTFQDNETGS
ncbi:MAG TPA: hypothetical protein PLV45_18635, partial [bacterium]|nr:hypothetical protein [bacterium]